MNRRAFFMLSLTPILAAFANLLHRSERLPPITVPAANPNALPSYMYASDGEPGLGVWQLQQWPIDATSQQEAILAAACCK